MSLLVVQLKREPTLRLLSSSQIGNGCQHHFPLATESGCSTEHCREKTPSLGLPSTRSMEAAKTLPGSCAALIVSCICAAGF